MQSPLLNARFGFRRIIGALVAIGLLASSAHAQRQMEKLGRGVIAVRSGTSAVYVGWRLLAADSEGVGFNLYRSQNGSAAVKLNSLPITNTTDYVDATATLTVSNAWFVRAVTNGVELAPSAPFGIAANAAVPVDFQGKLGPYISIPLQPIPGNGFDVAHVWPADFDGDGEYDFALTRLPDGTGVSPRPVVEAYLRNGTFLWRMDMGYNSTDPDFSASGVSGGHSDNVTAYDLDGDGKAEVLVRTARGVTVTNAAGVQVASVTGPDDATQYISVFDGQTGALKAQAVLPNPVPSATPLSAHFGIMYGDGIHPSLVVEALNRNADGSFNWSITIWDYRNGQLTNRWLWSPVGGNYSRAHQIRIADVDHDGKDEFCEINFVLHDDGDHATPLYNNELLHGDRYHIADLDPDRPGLETYAIQQDNPNLLATALFDSATGKIIKKWYSAGVADVARGDAAELDLNTRGVELFSTQPGLWSCQGDLVNNSPPYPNFGIWWDADLAREQLDDAKINKYGGGRLLSPYYMPGYKSGLPTWRNAQPLYGDLFGDWREEVLFESTDHSSLIIFTPVSPAATRLVCLAQNPEYRACLTVKGYMQSTWPSFYLGSQMQPPCPPPQMNSKLVWRGGAGNVWDSGAANWVTNWIHVGNANTNPAPFNVGDSVLFDGSGSNHAAITLSGTLTPGDVAVYAPKDFVFNGSAGSLSGAMRLTKAGAGRLTLTGTNDFAGATTIWEGSLIVNGTLSASPVTVRGGVWLDGAIGGTGLIARGATVYRGGNIYPGNGTNSPGTLTISNGVSLVDGAFCRFDLSDDPTGTTKTNDLLNVMGNLTLTGTNHIVIVRLNSSLPPGTVYPLINYSGALVGSLANFDVSGVTGIPVALTNPPGQIALVVKSYRAPATISWTGGSAGNAWDLLTSSNWLNGAAKDVFAPNDSIRFDSAGTSNLTVTLSGGLNAANVIVDSTANYTLTGSGGIIGSAGLTKTNSGTLTINALNNSFTGKTLVSGGTLSVLELDATGFPSPLGNPPGGSTNLVLSGGATLRVTGESYTDRGLTLSSGTNAIEVFNGGDQVTIAGQIVGVGALQKTGPGTLALTRNNTYTGATVIKGGNVSLGAGTVNQYGFGPGPGGNGNTTVTLDGGSITMFSDTASYDTIYWNLVVPTNSTGTIYGDDRCNLYGTLTGGGTLNFRINYIRTEFNGNWSAFTGQINVTTSDGSGDFRIGNTTGYANAALNLASGISAYHVSGSGVAVGAVSGSTGSTMSGTPWTVGAKNADATFAGNITGNSITKVGTGTWTLTGTNTYTGGTTINGGTLTIMGTSATPMGTGSVVVNGIGTLNPAPAAGTTVTLVNTVTGLGNISTTGAGSTVITGNETGFTGNFTHTTTNGSVQFNSATSGSANAAYNVAVASTLSQGVIAAANGDYTVNLGSLSGVPNSLIRGGNVATGTTTFSIGNRGNSTTFAGVIANGASKTIAITKVGAGTLTFSGVNTYTGNTAVNAGKLSSATTGSSRSVFTVSSGATNGILLASAGGQWINASNVTHNAGSQLDIDFGVFAPSTTIAPMSVANFTLNATTKLKIIGLTTNFIGGQTYPLVTWSGTGPANTNGIALITPALVIGHLAIVGNKLSLVISTAGPSAPATLTNNINGNTLSLSWPAGQGWRLQQQTNGLSVGLGTNWIYVTDGSVNNTNITIDSTWAAVFYRLIYP